MPDLPTLDDPLSCLTGVTTRSQSRHAAPAAAAPIDAHPSLKVARALKKIGTAPTYKVTGNTVLYNIFTNNISSINTVLTDEILFQFSSVGGKDENIDDNNDISS